MWKREGEENDRGKKKRRRKNFLRNLIIFCSLSQNYEG
jgi:hypothetical protein